MIAIIAAAGTVLVLLNKMDGNRKELREELRTDRVEFHAQQVADKAEFHAQQIADKAEFREEQRLLVESVRAEIQLAATRTPQAELDLARQEAANDLRQRYGHTHGSDN